MHGYLVALDAGQLLHATARQDGADVVLALLGPEGRELPVDSPNGSPGFSDQARLTAKTFSDVVLGPIADARPGFAAERKRNPLPISYCMSKVS